jgi:ubiquinone/menaquinone biosynthesis C-methylase UbiE
VPPARRPQRGRDVDFTSLASRYDDLRPADSNWWRVFEAIAAELGAGAERTLDVGCGTGRIARALAERGMRVWAFNPSDAMLEQARAVPARNVVYARAAAEALPFEDASFDGAVLRQVVHLVDRRRVFAEMARVLVPGASVVVATFHPDHFDAVWTARFFPRVAEIDRARFPAPEELAGELRTAGFAAPRERRLRQSARLSREEALERLRGRYISTLQLLDDAELHEGLARAERELPDELVHELDWVVTAARRNP